MMMIRTGKKLKLKLKHLDQIETEILRRREEASQLRNKGNKKKINDM